MRDKDSQASPVVLGLDLAWKQGNPSGAVRMAREDGLWRTVEQRCLGDDEDVLSWVQERAPRGPAVLAIDAPLIAPNPAGTGRACDREVSRRFTRFHAGAHSANRELCARPLRFAERLIHLGWALDPTRAGSSTDRFALEVYPHVASIGLLGIERIVKYKKGRVDSRRAGLVRLQELLHERLPALDPSVRPFAAEEVGSLRGKALKDLEDRLDAVLCAAMAVRWWERRDRCEVIGDLREGYILIPRLDEPTGHPIAEAGR